MKTKNLLFLLLVAVVTAFTSCKKDKKPETLPTVVTDVPTNITTTTASLSGKITNDGNATVTEAGFVYSNAVSEPTTADNKAQVTNFDTFTAVLQGLSSGKTYRVRAYAVNAIGTAYGELRTFETGNQAPVASNVQVAGEFVVGKTLTANYTYLDSEGDAESGTTFQWYSASSADGSGEAPISGATSKTFVILDAQQGKFIRVSVTPKASVGTTTGADVKSLYSTAVGAETVTFTYNSAQVTYGTIASSKTGKKWLDRNLGAIRVATAVDDYQAMGHYFQWGRLADTHQLVTRTGPDDADVTAVNGRGTKDKSTTVVPPDGLFIREGSAVGGTGDWLNPQNDNLWQGVNGINNPCPAGWRLATKEEWIAEGITSMADGFNKLKLTYTGLRDGTDAFFYSSKTLGSYWTSTATSDSGIKYSAGIRIQDDFKVDLLFIRETGMPCRCIKN